MKSPCHKQTNISAFILAAGLGSRLKPITEKLPKPLIPLGNITLLEWVFEQIRNTGIRNIGINIHYHQKLMMKFLNFLPYKNEISVFKEATLLGTGGPLVNAACFVKNSDIILIHNSDIITDFPLHNLIELHKKNTRKYENYLATMLVIDGYENRVSVTDIMQNGKYENAKVIDILNRLNKQKNGHKLLTYCGIMALSPQILNFLPNQPIYYSLIDALTDSLQKYPNSIGACIISKKAYWQDAGTFRRYINIHEQIMKKESPLQKHPAYERIVLTTNKIVSGLLQAASSRKFYRINLKAGKMSYKTVDSPTPNKLFTSLYPKPFIVMLSSSQDKDFMRYIKLGKYFSELKLQTPVIYEYNEKEFSVIMEDLGDIQLKNRLEKFLSFFDLKNTQVIPDRKKSENKIKNLYRKVIDTLIIFQTRATTELHKKGKQLLAPDVYELLVNKNKNISLHKVFASDEEILRLFDYRYLRWETTYFAKEFLTGFLKIRKSEVNRLGFIFEQLALGVLCHPYILIHRDFQSSNIMLHQNTIRFVDFQGARIGPFAYDIMSLLWDPYVYIPNTIREELLSYYLSNINETACLKFGITSGDIPPKEILLKYAYEAGMQRLMQALGAYAFLGIKKGKKHYLSYISRALENLNDILSKYADGFPESNMEPLFNMIKKSKLPKDGGKND